MTCIFVNICVKCMNSVSFCRLKTFSRCLFTTEFKSLKYFSTKGQPAISDDFVPKKSKSVLKTIGVTGSKSSKVKKKSAVKEVKHKKDEKELTSIVESVDSFHTLNGVKDVVISALQENEGELYLIDPAAADHLSSFIASEVNNNCSMLIEANPGLGLLTRRLLASGISSIRLFESNLHFFEHLKNKEFPGVVDIYNKDIIRYWKMQFLDRKDGGKRSHIFSGITPKDWEDDPFVSVIAAIPDIKFVSCILDNVITKTGFVKHGRPEFFLIMDPYTFNVMANGETLGYKYYRSYCVLFQALLDYQVLSKNVPRNAYLPSEKFKKVTRLRKMVMSLYCTNHYAVFKQLMEKEGHYLYVVKVTPKRDLYSSDFGRVLPAFSFFVKQLFTSCSRRIIPQLEQWVPGCGPQMIADGYNIYTEVGELSPTEIREIFLKFLSWTEATESTFFVTMDSYLLKKVDPDEHDNINEQ